MKAESLKTQILNVFNVRVQSVFLCVESEIYSQVSLSTHASGLPNTSKQHLFSSIYPRPSVPRRETTGLLLSISSCTGGAQGDKFNSYQSPLARHQAHVVPEQMLFKVYIVLVLVLCSVSDTCFNHWRVASSSVIASSRLADYPIIL